jgi:hypothetical protein
MGFDYFKMVFMKNVKAHNIVLILFVMLVKILHIELSSKKFVFQLNKIIVIHMII